MSLPWKDIQWRDFEILTLHFAENLLPGTRFDDHLKQGSRQAGIDLIDRSQSSDRPVCIQCKREKTLTPAKIRELVSTFLKGKYAVPQTRFILATIADLHRELLVDTLDEQRELLKKNDIYFEWWDPETIGTHLQRMWPLVAHFFSLHLANAFCFPSIRTPFYEHPPLDPVLPRRIFSIVTNMDTIGAFWQATGGRSTQMSELFTDDRLAIRRLGIIADPYLGKSTYLRQCAYNLANAGQGIHPLFVNVKDENIEPVDIILARRYTQWESIPLKNVIVFIDGLDEAHSNDVVALTKYVDGFAVQYPSVSIVVSCRRQFYDQYQLSGRLREFQFYGFSPLLPDDVSQYIKNRFAGHASQFNKAVARKQFGSWLQHPFYLNQLIEEFKRSGKLPASKTKAIDIFVEQAYMASLDRSFDKGTLAESAHHSRMAAQKLAIILQLVEKNALDDDWFQQLFSSFERKLLQHNPLVTSKEGRWSFTNAFFQEHLAALQLLQSPFLTQRDLLTVGTTHRKVRTRWMQTFYALLSLLNKQNVHFEQVRQLLDDDNPELIFASEPSLHRHDFRLECLHRLIAYCLENQLWPQLTYPDKIGEFLSGTPQVLWVLFGHLQDANFPISIKVVCCRIITGIQNLSFTEKQDILALVHSLVPFTPDKQYASELIAILSAHELGTLKDIQVILESSTFHQYHVFRDEMYEWILRLGLTCQFWTYGIEGIPILISHNKPISQSGSERNLENFLLSFKGRLQLYPLFEAMRTPEWIEFYQYKNNFMEGFVSQLLHKCVDSLPKNPLMALPLANLLEHSGRIYLREDQVVLGGIISDPGARDLLARHFGAALFLPNNWELGALVNSRSLDYLLYEFEEADLPLRNLQTPLIVLDKLPDGQEGKAYGKLVDQITADFLKNPSEVTEYKRMQREEVQRIDQDIFCIQSVTTFRNVIKRLFALHQSELISVHTLYGERTGKKHIAASHFVTQFIHHWIMVGETVKLATCLTFLENEDHFRYFRATEILQYHLDLPRTQSVLLPFLSEYYYTEIEKCRFADTVNNRAAGNNSPLEELVVNIFAKHRFLTSPGRLVEFLWMDAVGFTGKHPYATPQDILRNHVQEALGDGARHLLIEAILEHLRIGIPCEGVLASHFDLCSRLSITEAQPYLLDALFSRSVAENDLPQTVDIYIGLDGDLSKLLPLLDSISPNDTLFCHLLTVLSDEFPTVVLNKALNAISAGNLPLRENISMAKLLIAIGEVEGFRYLVEMFSRRLKMEHYLSGITFTRIDTLQVLFLLKPLLSLLVDPAYATVRSPENPRAIVYDWLNALAAKSEPDLLVVIQYLQETEEQLKTQGWDIADLRWYIFRITEKLRDMGPASYSVQQIKDFLSNATPV